ncbi:hypothetical protein EHS25_004895 [Saitozyma podzolica]|uniref:Uncharacterized protein n=1 Tax=Saitozyma podzolica TaxID=1890683 RepID=A0A427Y354_9TREE|nr:hypothetical protein EHS25_004895 [Saitozyma podzolica]
MRGMPEESPVPRHREWIPECSGASDLFVSPKRFVPTLLRSGKVRGDHQAPQRRSRIPASTACPFLVPFITSQGLWTGMRDLLGPVKHNATAARVVANSSQAIAAGRSRLPRTPLTRIVF